MKRHGDLLIIAVDSIPQNTEAVKPSKRGLVLAYGEVTGHAHILAPVGTTKLQLVQDKEQNMYFTVEEGEAQLTHEEHNRLTFAPGTYKVIHQRQYTPTEIVRVVD